MSKLIKGMIVSELRDRIGDVQELLVVDPSKLDAITTNRMRLSLREKDISLLSVKNSLARVALNEMGISALDSVLAGPSALVWGSEDVVALSKEISKWAREVEGFEIKGGTVEGTTLSAEEVDSLSKSPGRMELIGQIAGLALSPGARLSAALLGPGGKLAGQVKSKADADE